MLISPPLSPSQKERESNLGREQKAVFASKISWRKITITSLTEVTMVSTTNVRHERKKSSLWMLKNRFVCRLEIGPKRCDKLNPEPGPIYSSAPSRWIIRTLSLFLCVETVSSWGDTREMLVLRSSLLRGIALVAFTVGETRFKKIVFASDNNLVILCGSVRNILRTRAGSGRL